ncbi:hypothetical protein Aple_075720 [Acrocarpospora pleiomorpha]|uniref:Uncharacterized protein n=1 Tax=Acrocarpospora pleiomorpha TaxID=90975 RepID=A0A5M3XYY8_9ACTN|nr:hypothetical protein Aple_075720 [Acrocarpospora pleiomorpha]
MSNCQITERIHRSCFTSGWMCVADTYLVVPHNAIPRYGQDGSDGDSISIDTIGYGGVPCVVSSGGAGS